MTFNQYLGGIFTRCSLHLLSLCVCARVCLCVSLILRCLDLIIIISEHYGNYCLFALDAESTQSTQQTARPEQSEHSDTTKPTPIDTRNDNDYSGKLE